MDTNSNKSHLIIFNKLLFILLFVVLFYISFLSFKIIKPIDPVHSGGPPVKTPSPPTPKSDVP